MDICVKPLVIADLKPALSPTLVTDQDGLNRVADFFRRVKVFGFDTETNITPSFVRRKVRTIQVGNRDEQYVIDLLPFAGSSQRLHDEQGGKKTPAWAAPVVDTLRVALNSRDHLKVGANLQFDYEVMVWCLGVRSWNFYDVQIAEKVIYAGQVNFFQEGFWALDDLVARYCHLKISKEEQKSFDLETPLTEAQIAYAALDTRLPLAVMAGQKAVIETAKLGRTVKIENDAVPAFGEIHVNGVLLDVPSWNAMGDETRIKHTENVAVLDKFFIPVVGRKQDADKWSEEALRRLESVWRDETDRALRAVARKAYQAAGKEHRTWLEKSPKMEGQANINYGAGEQVLQALYKLGFNRKNLSSTNDKVLAKHSDKPVIRALQDYRETKQIIKSFGEGFLRHIDPDTGRVHSTFNQMGAETGRTSSSNPNIQNIKKEKKWRACFKARKGRKTVSTDMAGAELCIMADDSGDETWIAAFENGWDLHSVGAEMAEPEKWAACTLEGCAFASRKVKCSCPVHLKLRDDNKATNFGVCIAEGQEVLTDMGMFPIEDVPITAKVWDGVAFVNHSGVIYQGVKDVIDYDGLVATPEHNVWLEDGRKVSIGSAASSLARPRLAVTEVEGNPVRFTHDSVGQDSHGSESGPSSLCTVFNLRSSLRGVGAEHFEREDEKLSEMLQAEVQRRSARCSTWRSLRRHVAALHKPWKLFLEELRWEGYRKQVQNERTVYFLRTEDPSSSELQRCRYRQNKQRRTLRTGKPSFSHAEGKPSEPKKARVYDILNAGPRHRFTVAGKLVSNCYGMEEAALAAKLHISKEEAGKKLARWRVVNGGVHKYLTASGQTAVQTFCAHDMVGRRRLFAKPDWKRAAAIAREREAEDAKKAGRQPRVVDSRMVGGVYYAMFGSIEREGKNMRIQGTNASIAKLAMGCGFDKDDKPFMWHLLPGCDAELQNFIHDEFVAEAPDDKAESCAAIQRDCILRAGAEVLSRVKMLSASRVGDCWTK